jgi:hypothetical protein
MLLAGCVTAGDSGAIWQEVDGTALLAFTERDIITLADDLLSVARVLDRRGKTWTVRSGGVIRDWRVQRDDGTLTIARDGEMKRYRVFAGATPDLAVRPVAFPAPAQLDPIRVQEITASIDVRFAEDQAVRKDSARHGEVRQVTADNKRHLLNLTREVGWIDATRFGPKTAYRALIVAKHTGDLRLLLGVLPYAEHDFAQPGPDSQAFAILYDELQLKTGGIQRYGTQVCREPDGGPVMCSMEEPSTVDHNRAALGLPPLRDYLQLISKHLYNGREVRIPNEADGQ